MSEHDFVIWFDSKTGIDPSQEEFAAFVEELTEVANKHNFDKFTWGKPKSIKRYFDSLETTGYFDADNDDDED